MDRAFIRDVHTDPSALGVASAVVAMAHSLDLRVVAEGVDCAEQIEPLRRMGCDLIQGFIFSAALDPGEFARYLTPEGRRVPLQPVETSASPTRDLVDAEILAMGGDVVIASGEKAASGETAASEETAASGETVASGETIAPGETVASGGSQGDCPDRYALIIDDDRTHIGRTAMRMNQMGIPSYYARCPDEGILFALQEPGRIGALLVSSETSPSDVERIAQQVANQSQGDRPSVVVVGEKFDPAVITDLQQKGPVWSLRIPFDDAELNFVADAALSKAGEQGFPERNRVPIHVMVWTRIGEVTGHGVISALSPRGAFIEMNDPLPVGTAFQLEFSLSDWPVSVRARVVYLVGNDDGGLGRPKGVGVVFLDRDRETGERIFEEVEKRSARYTP
jgi:Tfp pilus assembly protein PilZ